MTAHPPSRQARNYSIKGTKGTSRAEGLARKAADEFVKIVHEKKAYCICCGKTERRSGSYPVCPNCITTNNRNGTR